MSKKELIVTDTIRYKIYSFFRKLFSKNKHEEVKKDNPIQTKQDNQNFLQTISYRNQIENLNKKKEIAEKLMNGKLSIEILSDNEVDEMIDYFNVYIRDMNQKLEQIKKYIINKKNKN